MSRLCVGIIIVSSLLSSIVDAGTTSGIIIGSAIASHNNNKIKHSFECIGQGAYLKKYIYFSENETSTNYYAIKTPWIVLHAKKARDRLESYGAYIYDSNPSSECEWMVSYDYDWYNDNVLTKGNRTEELNAWAFKATQATVSLEWFLIFSFLWFPALIIGIVVCVSHCRDSRSSSGTQTLDQLHQIRESEYRRFHSRV